MKDSPDIWQVWGGVSGVQTTLPVLLTEGVHRRGLPLPMLVRLACGNPARIFGLAPRKGHLRPGSDADLALIDLDGAWELRSDDLLTRNRLSPFVGRRFRGRVRRTLVRGRTVYRAGEIVAPPGHGQPVTPLQ
jgi:allantoinase